MFGNLRGSLANSVLSMKSMSRTGLLVGVSSSRQHGAEYCQELAISIWGPRMMIQWCTWEKDGPGPMKVMICLF